MPLSLRFHKLTILVKGDTFSNVSPPTDPIVGIRLTTIGGKTAVIIIVASSVRLGVRTTKIAVELRLG